MARDLVVLLHGILRSKTDMLPLSLYLRGRGYETINVLYPSRRRSLEDLADYVHEKISASPYYREAPRLHFVAHSMGGIIARYYVAKYAPANLGKVVMLAPPNTGSEFADFLSGHPLLKNFYLKMFGPAGQQLGTARAKDYPLLSCPVGIIAGTRSINPLAIGVLPRGHDGIVTVERTRLPGMADHITLPVTHTFMMFNPEVMRQTLRFLQEGKFEARRSGPAKIQKNQL